MQIRIQGKQVQLIRNPYNKEKKRCVQKVIATFDKYADMNRSDGGEGLLSAEQWTDLSDDEKVTLSDWLTAQAQSRSDSSLRFAVSEAARTLDKVRQGIEKFDTTQEQANAIWEGLAALQKALKKRGHPRPRKGGDAAGEGDSV